jgi:hypothetical protein
MLNYATSFSFIPEKDKGTTIIRRQNRYLSVHVWDARCHPQIRQNSQQLPTDQPNVRLISHFKRIECAAGCCHKGRPKSVTNKEPMMAVLAQLINSAEKSTRKSSQHSAVSQTSIQHALKMNHFHNRKFITFRICMVTTQITEQFLIGSFKMKIDRYW